MAKQKTDVIMEDYQLPRDTEEGLEKLERSETEHAEKHLTNKRGSWTKTSFRRYKKITPVAESQPKENGVKPDDELQNGVSNDEDPDVPPEGGWGWVVCFASMCTNGTILAIVNTFGIMLVALMEKYGEDDTNISFKASWVGSTSTGVMYLLSMVSGILADRLGIRTVGLIGGLLALVGMLSSAFVQNLSLLYLTYGVIMGTGFSLAYTPSQAILGHYFKRRIGLANGLVTFGGVAVFTVSYTLALPVLFDAIGFKYTLMCISGINGLIMLYALAWKPRIHCRPDSGKELAPADTRRKCCPSFLNTRIWRNRSYVVWVIATSVSYLGKFVLVYHVVKHADDVFPGSNSNLLPICLGVPNAVMKLVMGSLSDLQLVSRVRIQQAAFFVMGVTTTCAPLASTFTSLLVIAVVLGMCDGTITCMFVPVAFDLVGPVDSTQGLGFVFGLLALPASLGPPLAGLLYDHFGNYNLAFHVAGIPLFAGAVMMVFIPQRKLHTIPDIAIVEVPLPAAPSANHVASHKPNEPMAMEHVTSAGV